MSTITACPRCSQHVTLPHGAESSDLVRCPLCDAQYALEEALAKVPPQLIVVNSLAVVGPDHPAESESALHLFSAAESTFNLAEAGEGGLDLEDAAAGAAILPPDLNAHNPLANDRPADDFDAAEADELELPSDELPLEISAAEEPAGSAWNGDDLPLAGALDEESGEEVHDLGADASLEAEHGDFLASFDEPEPLAGEAEAAIPLGDLPAEDEPAALEFGDALEEENGEALEFASEEDETGFDTVNLDSGFEETRPIPDDVEGYALDQESAEAEESPEEAVAAPPTRPARRKPSKITSVIMYVLSLLIALPAACFILMYYGKIDPLNLASILPASLVPRELQPKPKPGANLVHTPLPAAADPNAGAPADGDQPSADDAAPGDVASGDAAPDAGTPDASAIASDPAADMPADDAADAPADDMPADDVTASDADADAAADTAAADMPADDSIAADDADADAADMPADDLLSDDATAADADADSAAMAADEATHDPDAGPGDADLADTDAAPSDDAMPAEEPALAGEIVVDEVDVPADAADMPADADMGDAVAADPVDADDTTDIPAPGATADDAAIGSALDDAMADDNVAEPQIAVGPRDSVEYSSEDIDRALTEVAAASKVLAAAEKADLKKAKGQYYRKLYQLAEVATFTPSMAAGAEPAKGSQQDEVEHMLTGAAASPGRFAEVGKAAAQWLTAIKGKEHQGIVLTGTIKSTRQRGQVFETVILLTDEKNLVTVLSPAAPAVGPQSAVLVWGSVADDPAQSIAGYEGDAPTAVWTPGIEAAPRSARIGSPAAAARH